MEWQRELLSVGNMAGAVIRIGRTVHRRAGPWTSAVHDLLRHLERVGFRGAPRPLGTDADGCEVLTYIPGEVAHPRVLEDADLAAVARLIREYHVQVASFQPSPNASWSTDGQDPDTAHELVCHNDLAPWNLLIGPGGELAFIDWDLTAPGRRAWDLALAACTFVPMYPSAARQLERFRVFPQLAKTLLEIELEWDGAPLRLFATHLGSRWNFQKPVDEIVTILQVLEQRGGDCHALAGDLNALRPGDPTGTPPPGETRRGDAVDGAPRLTIGRLLDAGYVDCFRHIHPRRRGFTYPSPGGVAATRLHLRLTRVGPPPQCLRRNRHQLHAPRVGPFGRYGELRRTADGLLTTADAAPRFAH